MKQPIHRVRDFVFPSIGGSDAPLNYWTMKSLNIATTMRYIHPTSETLENSLSKMDDYNTKKTAAVIVQKRQTVPLRIAAKSAELT